MMNDTIKRENAINTLLRMDGTKIDKALAIGEIRSLPSADKLQGKWIRISSLYSLDRTYKCSVCGKVIDDMPMDEYYDPAYKGCPYCLTRMKGADDDSKRD